MLEFIVPFCCYGHNTLSFVGAARERGGPSGSPAAGDSVASCVCPVSGEFGGAPSGLGELEILGVLDECGSTEDGRADNLHVDVHANSCN